MDYSKKQEDLEKIRQKLYTQKEQQINDEDDRLRRAMEENEARKAKEDAEKEAWNRKMQKEMADHRYQAVSLNLNSLSIFLSVPNLIIKTLSPGHGFCLG